ncbi:MAG: hypothetical protein ACJ8CB_33990, partial [Ktedonobacteraceae bacterium]
FPTGRKVLYVMHILFIIKVWITCKGFHILPTKRKYFIHAATEREKTRYHLHAHCSHARYYCRHLLSARQKMSEAAQFIAPEIAPEEEAINR